MVIDFIYYSETFRAEDLCSLMLFLLLGYYRLLTSTNTSTMNKTQHTLAGEGKRTIIFI